MHADLVGRFWCFKLTNIFSLTEWFDILDSYPQSERRNDLDHPSHMLTVATRDLFNELDKTVKPVAPMQFWMVMLF